MPKSEITFKVTLKLDEKWASNRSQEEIVESIKDRMNTSLGFRGGIKRFSVVSKSTKV